MSPVARPGPAAHKRSLETYVVTVLRSCIPTLEQARDMALKQRVLNDAYDHFKDHFSLK